MAVSINMDKHLLWQIPVIVLVTAATLGYLTKGSTLLVDFINTIRDKLQLRKTLKVMEDDEITAKIRPLPRRDESGRFTPKRPGKSD